VGRIPIVGPTKACSSAWPAPLIHRLAGWRTASGWAGSHRVCRSAQSGQAQDRGRTGQWCIRGSVGHAPLRLARTGNSSLGTSASLIGSSLGEIADPATWATDNTAASLWPALRYLITTVAFDRRSPCAQQRVLLLQRPHYCRTRDTPAAYVRPTN
jgi:hypothetical protein